jgi:hypothetical protein
MGIIERITQAYGYANIDEAPDYEQYIFYKLTLEEIEGLLESDPQIFPQKSIFEVKDALNGIRIGFYYLRAASLQANDVNDIMIVTPKLIAAISYWLDASTRYVANDRTRLYYDSFLNCHNLIWEINQDLESP